MKQVLIAIPCQSSLLWTRLIVTLFNLDTSTCEHTLATQIRCLKMHISLGSALFAKIKTNLMIEMHQHFENFACYPLQYKMDNSILIMRGSRKFCQRGCLNLDNVVFLVAEGRDDPNTTISRPSSSRRPLTWRFAGVSIIAHLIDYLGIRINIARNPYIFVIFQGGGSGPHVPPLWIRQCLFYQHTWKHL